MTIWQVVQKLIHGIMKLLENMGYRPKMCPTRKIGRQNRSAYISRYLSEKEISVLESKTQ
jgi:hypothetical protein